MSYFLKSIFLLMILVDCKIKPIPLNWSWTKRIFTEKQPYNFTIKRVLKQRVILKKSKKNNKEVEAQLGYFKIRIKNKKAK